MNTQLAFTMIGFHLLVIFLPISMVVLFKWPQAWHHMIALFLGLLTGYINLASDEVQFPALLLIAFGFFIAFSHPKGAWQFALLLAIWIPVGELVRSLLEGNIEAILQEGFLPFVAFVPALLGTYAGITIRWAVTQYSAAKAQQ
ncbi:MAG: hypothetical protein AAB344_07710 [Bacteroidota bacterium]|jgi:hypothetical protein